MAEIILKNLELEYPVYNSTSYSLRSTLMMKLGGEMLAHNRVIHVRALQDINLSIKNGTRLGLIGPNGAGKTSLLRVMAGVYPPTWGTIHVEGEVSAMTDITLGMDMEATGYQNIIFRLIFMGLSFKQAYEMSPQIEEYCGLEDYLALPVRTYSSGMFLRLAFAISTSITPDILILDEMIGAGDAAFQEKAKERIEGLLTQSKILVLSSHDLGLIRHYCQEVIWLENGRIKMHAATNEVLDAYMNQT